MGLRLFVSHSGNDKDVVSLLVRLIRSALHLKHDEIRCTSIDGFRLPGGAETNDQLRNEVIEAETLVGLISANAIDSVFVLFELGARWGAKKHMVTLLAPGFSASKLAEPLKGINGLKCDSRPQLQQFIRELRATLNIIPEPPDVYDADIQAILDLQPPTTSAKQYPNMPTPADLILGRASQAMEELGVSSRFANLMDELSQFESESHKLHHIGSADLPATFAISDLIEVLALFPSETYKARVIAELGLRVKIASSERTQVLACFPSQTYKTRIAALLAPLIRN